MSSVSKPRVNARATTPADLIASNASGKMLTTPTHIRRTSNARRSVTRVPIHFDAAPLDVYVQHIRVCKRNQHLHAAPIDDEHVVRACPEQVRHVTQHVAA